MALTRQRRNKPVKSELPDGSRTGLFMLRMLIFVVLLIVVGWWGYTQVMQYIYGQFQLFNFHTSESATLPAGWSKEPRILLVHPLRTEKYLWQVRGDTIWPYHPRNDGWPLADTLWYSRGVKKKQRGSLEAWEEIGQADKQPSMLESWKEMFYRRDLDYKIITEPDLVRDYPNADILILPGTLLLSDEEKRGIKRFLENGGNVLAIWSIGCRTETGEWAGFDFLSEITGAATTQEVTDPTGGSSMVLYGDGPITAGIPPGTHLEFYTYNGSVAMMPIEQRSNTDAVVFYPYWRDTVQVNKPHIHGSDATIMHGNYLGGRFVWFNLTPESIQDYKDNTDIFMKMITNSISWLHGTPLVDVSVWPKGYHSGGTLAIEANGGGGDFQRAIEYASSNGVALDVLADADFTPASLPTSMYARGDFIIDANTLSKLKGNSLDDQTDWIGFQATRLERMTGKRPVGLFSLDWKVDLMTLEAAARNDLLFLFGNTDPRYYGPQTNLITRGGWWLFRRKAPLSLLPKYLLTMREFYELKDIKEPSALAKAMATDMHRVSDAGGLYIGVIDPVTVGANQNYTVMPQVISKMDSSGVWRMPVGTLIQRFSGWSGIRTSTKIISNSRIRVNVSNEGRVPIRDLYVETYLSNRFGNVRATSEVVGFSPASITWDSNAGVCAFVIPEMGAGENVAVFLDISGSAPSRPVAPEQGR